MKNVRALGVWAVAGLVAGQAWSLDRTGVAMLEITGTPSDAPAPLAWLAGPDAEPTLWQIVDTIQGLADDSRVGACVIRLKDAALSLSQAQEIGKAVAELSDAGKPVHVFAEGYGTVELVLGSYADDVIVQSGCEVALSGLYMEEMFLADTLGWVGVRAELVQVGDYKGANEQMTRSAPSPQWDENINQLLDGMYGEIRRTLMTNRNLTAERLDAAMEELWIMDPEKQVASGLVDASVDLAMLESHLEETHGGPVSWVEVNYQTGGKAIDTSNPFAILGLLSQSPKHEPKGPTIAVLHVQGPIIDGDSSYGGLFGEQSVGSRTIRNALEDIRDEDDIKGVVVRIDSPGGSAIASEVIWQGIERVAETKPVWVSVGSMAASGGYYVAVAGGRIYVNPSSIVGSIGVVGGKYAMGELYDKLKVRIVPRARGPRADIFSSASPWDAKTEALVRAKMAETYELFTSRVSAGREGIDLSKTAEGRLFVGARAVELNMADELGSLDDAITDLAAELGLETYEILDYPGPKGLDEFFDEMFSQYVRAPGVSGASGLDLPLAMLREIVGPRAWPGVRDGLAAMAQLRREPVLLTMPRTFIWR